MTTEMLKAHIALWERIQAAANRKDAKAVDSLLREDGEKFSLYDNNFEIVSAQAKHEIEYHRDWLRDLGEADVT
jgi:hypothetical protein